MLGDQFGFASVVYVCDHFDAALATITGDRQFPESSPVPFAELLCEAVCDGPFFVASKSDEDFFQAFTLEDAISVTTKRVIPETPEMDLCVSNPPFSLKYEHCHGYPGYCALYLELCALAATAADKAASRVRSKYAAVVDVTRRAIIGDQFLRLCLLIEGADSETLDVPTLNHLSYVGRFDVRVR
jgi:hypothetical protein